MSNKQSFSKRLGYSLKKSKEITIRTDAPEGLRSFVRVAYKDLDKQPSDLREIICKVLRISPDRNNWSEYPNIDSENEHYLERCDWYSVYDIIEAICYSVKTKNAHVFEEEINEYFIENGIGWKIVDGLVETRGDEIFETSIETIVEVLENAGLQTATTEIKEAIADLSRRPEPDVTGAIQHSLACLECVTREATGDRKATLGDLMRKYPDVIPSPLDQAITKIWGFTSEQGRHLREGRAPEYIEAELVVEVTAAISTYLGKKLKL